MARASAGPLINQVRGRVGDSVVALRPSGLAVRGLPRYKQFPNPATAGARQRLEAATEVWNTFGIQEVDLWEAYARTVVKVSPVSGNAYHPSAYNAFTALGTRFLQASPDGEIPVTPPGAPYPGDDLVVSVEAILGTGLERPDENLQRRDAEARRIEGTEDAMPGCPSPGSGPPPPAPSSISRTRGGRPSTSTRGNGRGGGIRFTASAPNAPGSITEILVQPLVNVRRKPTSFYKSAAFHVFSGPDLTFELELPPGPYAPAYRFVELATGQCTGLSTLGVIVVP